MKRHTGLYTESFIIGALALMSLFCDARPVRDAAERHIKQWEQLKYGMFIHFNMNTFAGAEYDNGKLPAESFNPSEPDVDQWVRTASESGMKYAVLTAKHTGGFCLWDSKAIWKGREYDYDIASSACKKDLIAQFVESCRKYGLKPALYYCLLDDHNQTVSTQEEYFRLTRDQITELVEGYMGLVEIWIDIPSILTPEQRTELYSIVKTHQPECLVTCNNGFSDGTTLDNFPADITNGERTLPPVAGHKPRRQINGKMYYIPMEVCQTINQNWFWMPGDVTKSVRTLYYWYSESVKRGANFLLDVPPDLSGKIPQNLVERLAELREVIDDPGKMQPLKSLTGYKPVKASSLFDRRVEYLPEYAVDEDPYTRWLADVADTLPVITVDLGSMKKFDKVILMEPYEAHILSFELQCLKGEEWETIFSGSGIGQQFVKQFPAVEARMIRIVVKDYKKGRNSFNVLSYPGEPPPMEGVTLSEFEVFR